MRHLLFSLLVAAGLGGCGLDRNIEDKVSIDQGVYGLLVTTCDSSGCVDQPAANEHVMVFAAASQGAYKSAVSDPDGIYQIMLPEGDYTLCVSACTQIRVPSGTVRYDWTSGPGGGSWTPN